MLLTRNAMKLIIAVEVFYINILIVRIADREMLRENFEKKITC